MAVPGKRAGEVRAPRKKNGATPEGEPAAEGQGGEAAGTEERPSNLPSTELTPEQTYALTKDWQRTWERSLDAVEAAKAEYDRLKTDHRGLGKKVKAELGDVGLARVKRLVELARDEEGEAKLMEEIQLLAWIHQFEQAHSGTQLEIFADLRPDDDRAHAMGRRDGLAGKPFQPSFAQGTLQLRRYEEGFQAGQEVLARGFKPLDKPPAPIGDQPSTHQVEGGEAEQPAETDG